MQGTTNAYGIVIETAEDVMNAKTMLCDLDNLGTQAQMAASLFSWEDSNIRVPMPVFDASVTTYNDKLFIFGGFKCSDSQATDQIQIYDFNTQSWSNATMLITVGLCGGALRDNEYFLFGGQTVTWNSSPYTDQIYKINLDTLVMTNVGTLPYPMSGIMALGAKSDNNLIFVVGGNGSSTNANISTYNIKTNTFTDTAITWPSGTQGIIRGMIFSYMSGGTELIYVRLGLTKTVPGNVFILNTNYIYAYYYSYDEIMYVYTATDAITPRRDMAYFDQEPIGNYNHVFIAGGETTGGAYETTVKMIGSSPAVNVDFPTTTPRKSGNLIKYKNYAYYLNGNTANASNLPVIMRMDISAFNRNVILVPSGSVTWATGNMTYYTTDQQLNSASTITRSDSFMTLGSMFDMVGLTSAARKSVFGFYPFIPTSLIPTDSTNEYTFDSQTGNDTKGSNNLTATDIEFNDGVIYGGAEFNKPTSSLVTNSPLILTETYTIGFWFFFNSTLLAKSNLLTIFTNKDNLTDSGVAFYKEAKRFCFQSGSNVANIVSTNSSNIQINKWTYLTFTSNGTNLSFYQNGAKYDGGTVTTSSISASSYFRIGSLSTDPSYLRCKIDQFRIWNRELLPSEISALSQEYTI